MLSRTFINCTTVAPHPPICCTNVASPPYLLPNRRILPPICCTTVAFPASPNTLVLRNYPGGGKARRVSAVVAQHKRRRRRWRRRVRRARAHPRARRPCRHGWLGGDRPGSGLGAVKGRECGRADRAEWLPAGRRCRESRARNRPQPAERGAVSRGRCLPQHPNGRGDADNAAAATAGAGSGAQAFGRIYIHIIHKIFICIIYVH
mmetsp:Transcript_30735/g.91256  ORF Transcript_30735/g.91256 Transcript_30735/m.91256 type:complete len:205 (-) Transcript_30735:308-922(-)